MKYPINDEGVDLLKVSESFVEVAYPDPVSPLGRALQKAGLWRATLKGAPIPEKFAKLSGAPWTIGWGFTDGVKQGDTMTLAAGNAKLARLLQSYAAAVSSACKIAPNENQLAALTVCAWNIGKGAIGTSSMIKAHNRGDCAAAARAFGLWNKAGGAVVPALVTRRAAEAALYLKPVEGAEGLMDDEVEAEPMPQTVQPETSLLRSPIVQGTGATAVTSLAALKEVADQASVASESVGTITNLLGVIGPYWPYIAMAAVLIVAGGTIWHRYQQRKQGWA